MTDRLRDLLRESVAEAEMRDAVDAAWGSARRARRRRAAALVAGAVALAGVVGGGAWLVARGTRGPAVAPVDHPSPSAGLSHSTSWSSSPSDRRTPHLGGVQPDRTVPGIGRVWWGPDPAQEANLPRWPSVVPPDIDLSADAPDIAHSPIFRAMAAFAVFDDSGPERVVVMTQDGRLRSVDVSDLGKVTRPNGYRLWPETRSMLSPTGEYLMFPQDGHLAVLRLLTGEWRIIETGAARTADATWSSDIDILLPAHGRSSQGPTYDVLTGVRSGSFGDVALIDPGSAGPASPYGRQREGVVGDARSYDLPAGVVPVKPGSLDILQALVVVRWDGAGGRDVLSFTSPVRDGRWKQCCSVVGWLDEGPVVYESIGTTPRLIAWRVGTHEFGQIATINGVEADREHYVSSWAGLWDRWPLR